MVTIIICLVTLGTISLLCSTAKMIVDREWFWVSEDRIASTTFMLSVACMFLATLIIILMYL